MKQGKCELVMEYSCKLRKIATRINKKKCMTEMLFANWFVAGLGPKFKVVLSAGEMEKLNDAVEIANILDIFGMPSHKKEKKKGKKIKKFSSLKTVGETTTSTMEKNIWHCTH